MRDDVRTRRSFGANYTHKRLLHVVFYFVAHHTMHSVPTHFVTHHLVAHFTMHHVPTHHVVTTVPIITTVHVLALVKILSVCGQDPDRQKRNHGGQHAAGNQFPDH